ncbi:MAG: hypothetical protein ACOCX5_01015 [Chloroflexota bacterium]
MSNEISFFSSDQVPQPRNKVKIESVQVEVYPDRRRVWINVRVTPFQERPNLLLVLRNDAGQLIGELSIIETMHADMEFTLHIRNVDDPAGAYILTADLFFENRNPPHDQKSLDFIIAAE